MSMKNRIISLLLAATALTFTAAASAQSVQGLKPDAPDRYTVERGDTLWGIAGRYLDKPWDWPRLWNLNRQQVRNPHRIFPGDVLVLDRATGRLRVETVAVRPRVRTEEITDAVSTIPPGVIEPFISRPMMISATNTSARCKCTSTSTQAHTKNLSATGSKNAPKEEA